MMYYPLMNEIQLVNLLVFMLGYITVMLLIVGIICGVIEYIDSRKGWVNELHWSARKRVKW